MISRFVQIFNSFSKKERYTFLGAFLVFVVTAAAFSVIFIRNNSTLVPIDGGEYTEGAIGQPTFINPVLAQNDSVDNDLATLVFSNLKDMSDSIEASGDQKTFQVRIKGDIFWQDGTPITADDVIYTIRAIQDPDLNSPDSQEWTGVKAERVSERELTVTIPAAYSYFQNVLSNLRPIPKHIFENIPFANLRLSSYNLEPVGSGPFQFSSFNKRRDGFITEYSFDKNKKYFGKIPYLSSINVKMYSNETDLIKAFNSGDVDGMAIYDPENISKISIPRQTFKIRTTKYYAVFFNNSDANSPLNNQAVRNALNLATDKNEMVKNVFNDLASPINGPIILDSYDQEEFSIDKANALLDADGWVVGDDGVREKNDKQGAARLEFTLTVYPSSFLLKTANLLKESWAKIGVKINIDAPAAETFNDNVIKTRNYSMLLFGNIYGENIDPYSFWDSSQRYYPGLNLSLFSDKNVDSLIDTVRTTFDETLRQKELQSVQSSIITSQPAIFLYSPYYIYITNKTLRGFDASFLPLPNDRFLNANNWYVKTARSFK